jgi:hypothetical protein
VKLSIPAQVPRRGIEVEGLFVLAEPLGHDRGTPDLQRVAANVADLGESLTRGGERFECGLQLASVLVSEPGAGEEEGRVPPIANRVEPLHCRQEVADSRSWVA